MSNFLNQYIAVDKFTYLKTSIISIILILTGILTLLPFLIISIYNHPSADDFNFYVNTENLGYFETQSNWYLTWTGRYFSSAIISLPIFLKSQSFAVYKTVPVLLFIGLMSSLMQLTKILFSTLSLLNRAALVSFFMVAFLAQIPSIAEGFYFLSATITYTLPCILLIVLLATIKKALLARKLRHRLLAILLTIAIVGCNETSMVLLNLILLTIIMFQYAVNKLFNRFLLIVFLICIMCSLIVYFSPGNSIRSLQFPEKHQFWYAIKKSAIALRGYLGKWMPALLVFGIALISLINKKIKHNPLVKIHPLLIIAITLLLVFIGFFVGYWSVGSLIPKRTINVLYFTFLLGFTVSIVSFVSNPSYRKYTKISPFISILLLLFTANNLFRESNISIVFSDLYSNTAQNYNKELQFRYSLLEDCSTNCTVPALNNLPATIYAYDITSDHRHWRNLSYAQYFKKNQISIQD